jgi:dienelactone hydrolase
MSRWFPLTLVLGAILTLAGSIDGIEDCALAAQSDAAIRVLADGESPPDRRLGPLRTLDTHCPFTPPATRTAWDARRADLQRQIRVALGLWPWPERTPLNARVHRTITRDDYIVEQIALESVPGHFVTGSVYKPRNKTGRLPAVLTPHGHWPGGRFQDVPDDEAKTAMATGAERSEVAAHHPLQARSVQLARMGAVTFLIDMLGYADSVQIPIGVAHRLLERRPEMESVMRWGFFSPQAELRLQSAMGLQIWNAIRAFDYLASRDDVDPNHIGVTGASGGATQTFILSAIDDRPAAIFPAVMVSTGMQGGCTCENANYLRIGTGNVEIAAITAPRPVGMTAADDWTKAFETDGYPDLQNLFTLVGAPDHVTLRAFLQFPHNYNAPSRAVMNDWFNRFLRLGWRAVPQERPFTALTQEEATVWNAAHPAPPGGPEYERNLLAWMTRESDRAIAALAPGDNATLTGFRDTVGGAWNVLLGGPLRDGSNVTFDERTTATVDSARLSAGLLRRGSNGSALPALIARPDGTPRGVLIWLSDDGKRGIFEAEGRFTGGVRRALAAGYAVFGVDLLQQGEFRADGRAIDKVPLASDRPYAGYTYGYNLPLAAERAQDVLSAIAYARSQADGGPVLLSARGTVAAIAAGARAMAGEAVARAALDTRGFRFMSVDRIDHPDLLPGSVKYGDVPALLALSAPQPVWVRDDKGDLALARQAYEAAGAGARLHVASGVAEDEVGWLLGGSL